MTLGSASGTKMVWLTYITVGIIRREMNDNTIGNWHVAIQNYNTHSNFHYKGDLNYVTPADQNFPFDT